MPWALCEAGGRLAAVELVDGRRSSVGGSGLVLLRWRLALGLGSDDCDDSELRRAWWCCEASPDDFREWVGIAAGIQVRWHTPDRDDG